MQIHPVTLFAILVSLFAAVVGLSRGSPFGSRHQILAGAVAVLPPAAMLALFYSLSAHMYCALGAWPTSLGVAGFPEPLATHASIAQFCFGFVLASTLFVLPVVALLCWFVPRGQSWVRLVGV